MADALSDSNGGKGARGRIGQAATNRKTGYLSVAEAQEPAQRGGVARSDAPQAGRNWSPGTSRLPCGHVPRREPLLAGDEFLAGETGHYQRPLVLIAQFPADHVEPLHVVFGCP